MKRLVFTALLEDLRAGVAGGPTPLLSEGEGEGDAGGVGSGAVGRLPSTVEVGSSASGM